MGETSGENEKLSYS